MPAVTRISGSPRRAAAFQVRPDSLSWNESGGFASTFSPNAAYVETVLQLSGGTTYTPNLQWKTNRNAPGATIYAGAGPINTKFSPTSRTTQLSG
jgi:hypothetical protein